MLRGEVKLLFSTAGAHLQEENGLLHLRGQSSERSPILLFLSGPLGSLCDHTPISVQEKAEETAGKEQHLRDSGEPAGPAPGHFLTPEYSQVAFSALSTQMLAEDKFPPFAVPLLLFAFIEKRTSLTTGNSDLYHSRSAPFRTHENARNHSLPFQKCVFVGYFPEYKQGTYYYSVLTRFSVNYLFSG